MVEKLLNLENDGLNLVQDESSLYIRCKRDLYRLDGADLSVTAHRTVLKKDGKARSLSVCGNVIWLVDFCDLHLLDKHDLRLIGSFHLGENASSDLSVVRFDEKYAYIGVRNGKIIRMDQETLSYETFTLSDSSFWDHAVSGGRLYAGTVSGSLLDVDTLSMHVTRSLMLCRKNIYTVLCRDETLYTVSQDGSIQSVDRSSFQPISAAGKAVRGMTRILGLSGKHLVIADGGVSLWDAQTLRLLDRFPFPTGHYNKGAILLGDTVIGSDDTGVYRCCL